MTFKFLIMYPKIPKNRQDILHIKNIDMGHTLGAGWQVLWVKCGASRDILGHRVTVTLGVGWWVTPRFLCFSESADAHRLTRANSTTRHRMMCECYICPNKKCLGIQNQNDKEY